MAGPIGDNQDKSIEEAVQQFVHARSHGREPDIDEFVKQYPELEHQLRQRLQNLEKIDALFDSLLQANEDDFEGTAISDNLVGQKLRDFEIVKVIGRGGMGVVYLAHDTKLGRSVAVKSMSADLAIAKTRFRREATLLASLNHPNIAVIHEIIEEKELDYLILEYVPGDTLAQRISRKPLKLQEALSIGRQIAEAVSAAHEKGIIHRDLKPANIKIMPDGRVKVLDFGLAKASVSENKNVENTVTQPGRVIGTPAYMSPEQARGKNTDHRTDIWSFGCIMYEMLTGQRPFEGETATDTIARILERQPDWDALPPETPANIRILLQRCLDKDPDQRLGDIKNVAIEISETLSKPATLSPPFISAKQRKIAMFIGAAIIIALSGIAVWLALTKQIQSSTKDIRLVVLPFENLGTEDDEYFADSITDQITSHLAPVRGLSVLSPRTAAQYKEGERDVRAIGKELGVDYILEGKVQPERPSDPNSGIRIMPQLIRASDDRLVLAPIYPIYNGDLNEFLQVQSDLVGQVIQALDVTLLEPERGTLVSRPTENTEAHKYYLRGNDYFHRSYEENDFRIAVKMYEKAVELDPTFALAYSRLSLAHSWTYWFYDRSKERLGMAKQAVDKAFQLNPDLPEAYSAMGRYYYNLLDFDSALEQFAIARKSLPNDSEILSHIGFAQRRQGKFEQALANIKRACDLDPLSSNITLQLAVTFMLMRKYTEAERYYERAILLSPDVAFPYFFKAGLYLLIEGNTEKAWAVFERAPQDALDHGWIVLRSIVLNVYDGDYPEALERLSSYEPEAFKNQFYYVPKALLYAQIYGLMGNKQLQEKYYESARNILEIKIQEQPDDEQFPERFHSSLGIAYAGLDRKEDAITQGQLGVELLPETKDAWRGQYRVEDLARIYVMVGELDKAVEQIEHLLSIPGEMSIPLIKLDPAWDPLRNHPRFKKLIESDK
jgi:serine/threonine protein kinase/Tfp pilus assembly protein PilF